MLQVGAQGFRNRVRDRTSPIVGGVRLLPRHLRFASGTASSCDYVLALDVVGDGGDSFLVPLVEDFLAALGFGHGVDGC